ncbi:MAG: hypothetical protein ABSG46_20140 [Candidatus Binataceae bacterium]|jgi:hypothetical protein
MSDLTAHALVHFGDELFPRLDKIINAFGMGQNEEEPPEIDPFLDDILAILKQGMHVQLGTTVEGEFYIRTLYYEGHPAQMQQGDLLKIVSRVRKTVAPAPADTPKGTE